MRVSHAIWAVLLGSRTVASSASADQTPKDVVRGAYIVELDSDADGPDSLYQALASDDRIAVDHLRDLRSSIFNAASFQVRDAATDDGHDAERFMEKVRAKRNVRNVWPVRTVYINKEVSKPSQIYSPVSRRHESRDVGEISNTTTFAPHIQTQIDKLRAEGYTGNGVRVAVVDSGVDYTHPALGGCFGPGCLVEGGYDFSGDDLNPETGIPASPDDDPYDYCMGHGTHVAGIVAAQAKDNELGFSGGAPGVKLLAYRVWGCGGGSTNELMIAGFNRAFEDGADIITCSNGYQSGWAQEAISVAVARIVEAGVPVLVSEGNDGNSGLFNALTPAVGAGVGGTGAVQNQVQPIFETAASFTVGDASTNATESQEFGFVAGEPLFTEDNLSLALHNLGTDACDPLPDDTPDLSGKLILLEVPDSRVTRCYPIDQATNILAKGGRYVLYYARDNTTVDEQFLYVDGIRGVGTVPPYRGSAWNDLLAQGTKITVSLPNLNTTSAVNMTTSSSFYYEEVESNVNGGRISDFTSWGPSWELSLSPQWLAPGGQIPGLYPVVMGAYKIMSGTSMAAPHVASIYALIKEARGSSDPKTIRSLLSSTAKPQAPLGSANNTGGLVASVAQQGAGLVQAYDAAHSTIILDIDGIALNDTDNFVGTHTFSIKNTGASDVTFDVGHAKAVTMYTFQEGSNGALLASNREADAWAELAFSTDKVVVPAGGSSNVTVTVTPPEGLNDTLVPIYSGYVTLKSDDQSLVLPYLGMVGSLVSTPVLDARNVYLANYNTPAESNKTYTIPRPDPSAFINTNRGDQATTPNVAIHPTVGTAQLRIDILGLTSGGNSTGLPTTPFFDRFESIGTLPGYPVPYTSNENRAAFFKGLMADGTVLPEGTYQLAISGLRVFGNASSADDWDTVQTVPFNLKYSVQ
ncbi:serine endopeptidase [Diaporthe amygdali]|uniref:serine endopeptidase n=1 Tax=Phomopsis amygdali TaxID=1214568 RepID=UPI0022FE3AAD|nr:serine endopeptidase [Diaporthe amygdali]KAJ0123019.1 serine endopeptidase [Diaporthe amygdali]